MPETMPLHRRCWRPPGAYSGCGRIRTGLAGDPKCLRDPGLKPCWIPCLAFPDFDDSPSGLRQLRPHPCIADDVPRELFRPEVDSRRGRRREPAAVAVPEAPVNQDDRAVLWEHQVWPAGQRGAMEAKAKPESVGTRADGHFGARVLAAHAAHYSRPRFRRDGVHVRCCGEPRPCGAWGPQAIGSRAGAPGPHSQGGQTSVLVQGEKSGLQARTPMGSHNPSHSLKTWGCWR